MTKRFWLIVLISSEGSLECPAAKYLAGWSHGKETLREGVYDIMKGSYYINCALNQGETVREHNDFPEMTAPNVWPPETILPGFRQTFEELCSHIIRTAILVARACDRYAEANIEGYEKGCLESVIQQSQLIKARLLHYFPIVESSLSEGTEFGAEDVWCTAHVDHGCLTGLTSALYVDEAAHPPQVSRDSSNTVPLLPSLSCPPDSDTGLYVKSRNSELVKVAIPPDCLGFQTGEALELMTKGHFKAVPHLVKSGKLGAGEIARNTLAVFTQPNLEVVLDKERGLTFGAFSKMVTERFG